MLNLKFKVLNIQKPLPFFLFSHAEKTIFKYYLFHINRVNLAFFHAFKDLKELSLNKNYLKNVN